MDWFFPQVGKVEIGPNLAYHNALQEDLIMNEMDGHCNMFDARCNCLGLEDVDARLAVFIYWQRANVAVIEAYDSTISWRKRLSQQLQRNREFRYRWDEVICISVAPSSNQW